MAWLGLSFCSARDTEPPATGVALLLPVRLLSRQAGARADTLRPSRRSCRCRQLGRRPSRHRACRYCPSCRRRAACRRSSCQGIVARAACRPSCRRRAARRPRPKAGAAASSARFLRTAVMLCTGVSFGSEIFELLSNREVIGACRLGRPRAGQGLKVPRSRARTPAGPKACSHNSPFARDPAAPDPAGSPDPATPSDATRQALVVAVAPRLRGCA